MIRKIFLCMLILLINLSVNVYANYNYKYNFRAFSLTRDESLITYNIRKSVDNEIYTNSDVVLSIDLNKPVDKIDGFDISEDGMKLTKIIKENETQTIVVEDISGNRCEIPYAVSNIDKVPPEILGVQDGETCKAPKRVDYKDNVGIKKIYVDRYSSLQWMTYTDYYDTSFYKGIDVTDKTITVDIFSHPKNTSYYKYYLNGNLKAQTDQTKFKFTGLNFGTTYEVKIEALDKDNNVLQSSKENIKTKHFSNIQTEKQANTFKVTLYGINPKVQRATAYAFTNINNAKNYNTTINSDRSLTITFSALDVTPSLYGGYYYFHIQLFENNNILETVCCNVIFNTTYIENDEPIDPYNLKEKGKYQIIVTDLAGNSTTRDITIN